MTLEEYKKNKSGHTKFKFLKGFIAKLIVSAFLAVSVLAMCKLSDNTKKLIKEELFQTDFNFSKINKLYKGIFEKADDKSKTVSLNNEINYTDYQTYKDGVSLKTKNGESASFLDSGIVVFIGEKEGYGNVLIVQQSNGVDVWYGNIDNINVNLYDYVNKNTSFATLKDNLYLVFQKNGEFLDYKEYIN